MIFLTFGRYAIAKRKSYSHILQIAISLGQLYGTAVYFITSFLEGDNFATNSFYYYAYYIFANSFWVWIPTLIVIRSWSKICAAFTAQEQKNSKAKKRWRLAMKYKLDLFDYPFMCGGIYTYILIIQWDMYACKSYNEIFGYPYQI